MSRDTFDVDRATLSDGSIVFSVTGTDSESGISFTPAAEDARHARRLCDALNACAWMECTVPHDGATVAAYRDAWEAWEAGTRDPSSESVEFLRGALAWNDRNGEYDGLAFRDLLDCVAQILSYNRIPAGG